MDYLELYRDGVIRVDIAKALGLLGDADKFTRTFVSEQVQKLELEGRIRSEEKGRTKVYFPVGHNQPPVAG